MNSRSFVLALLATLCAGPTGGAGAQGFVSVSSFPTAVPAPVAAPAAPAPAASIAPPPGSTPTVAPVPVPAATLAFSSVSTLGSGDAAGAAGSGPLLPAPVAGLVMADRILIEKGKRRLYLMKGGAVLAEYPVKLGLSPKGHKRYEGDFRTPEGVYYVSRRNPRSEYFLSVEVSYPSLADRARAEQEGVRPGGLIMIHGQPNVPRKSREYYARTDWTDGCIAVSNAHMAEIWQRTRVGTTIEIRP